MAGSGTNQTIGQSVQQQTLPAWENSGYQNIASQAFGQAFDPTTGLPNGAPANQSVAGQTGNFSNYLNSANGAPNTGSGLTNNLQGYNPNVTFDPTHTGTWGQQAADQYMNPYTNSVLHSQEALAHDTYGQQKAALDQNAAASGALGGDRNAVAQSGLDNDFALQEQNLQANALNSAYQNAQSQFNNDQNRTLQSDVTNSQLGLASGIQNAELNYGARAASNQFELGQGNLNLSGLSQAGLAAQLSQGYAQSKNDTDYQNAMMNYLFPEQQISYAQGVLNGTPKQWTTQEDTYLPQGNPFSQALGAQQAKGSNKGGGGGGTSAKPGGSGGSGSGGGGGFKPPPFTPPGQTQPNVPTPPNLNLPWNTEPDTSGAFTQTPTPPNYPFQTPSFTPPTGGGSVNFPDPPDINASSGSGMYGDAQSVFDPMPSDANDPNSALNQYTNTWGDSALPPPYTGYDFNSGQQAPIDFSNYAANPYYNGYGSSAIYGDNSTQPGFDNPYDPYSAMNYGMASGGAPAYSDPNIAYSQTGYPYNANAYSEPDVYGLYPGDYQHFDGLEES